MLPSNYQCEGQMSIFEYVQESQSGRTSPEPSVQITEKILEPSLKCWQESKTPKLQYLVKYKALGNSIALPYWEWLAKQVVKSLDEDNLTMGSLFDGIGGFPLAFSRAGVKPIWASEIEEFPIAVTKKRFPEGE